MRTIVAGDWAVYCEEAHVFDIHSHTGNSTTPVPGIPPPVMVSAALTFAIGERQRGVEPSLAAAEPLIRNAHRDASTAREQRYRSALAPLSMTLMVPEHLPADAQAFGRNSQHLKPRNS